MRSERAIQISSPSMTKTFSWSNIFARDELMSVRDAIRFIEADGWQLVRTKGSHRQFKHPFKKGRVTVSGRLDMDLHPKTLKSILKQAGIDDIVND